MYQWDVESVTLLFTLSREFPWFRTDISISRLVYKSGSYRNHLWLLR